jgi:hypothetical protein
VARKRERERKEGKKRGGKAKEDAREGYFSY